MKFTLSSVSAVTVKPRESFAEFDLSSESLEKIARSFPEGLVNFDINTDLTPVCFPVLVANTFNKNGEGVDSIAAVAIADTLPHKFTDLNHDRKQVVGHIVGTSFSKFADDHEPMTREEALASTEPFNVICYGVVYDKVNPNFAKELISSADDKVWSASWELVYDNFNIGVGSGLMKDVKVLKGKEAYASSKYLRSNKGTGFNDNNEEVRRIIGGNVLGAGIGFTQKPAASVKGVAIAEFEVKEDLEDANSSHSSETDVTNNRNKKAMDEEILKRLDALIKALGPQESQASTLANLFADEIKAKSEQWVADKKKLQEDKDAADAEIQRQKDLVLSNASELEQARKDIDALKAAAAQSLASETFNARMAEVDSKFELTEAQRPFVAKELSGLSVDEESFAAALEKFTVLFPEKKKTSDASVVSDEEIDSRVKAEIEKRIPAIAKQTSLAETEVRELLSTASVTEAGIPNGGETKAPTLREKWLSGLNAKDAVKVG